jgi:cell division initiation protein
MDRILPVELEHVKLRTVMRGYNKDDVDELIKRVSGTLEELLEENASLRESMDKQKSELEMLRRDSRFVQEALITAQKTADEVRASTQKHADLILEEARQLAAAEKSAAHQKVTEMRWELDRLTLERQRFMDDFKALLERHLREIANNSAQLELMEGTGG